jgi:aminoglycoside phosphotransferase (APT) family kinase protein
MTRVRNEGLDRLAAQLEPGGRLVRRRRLRGGISARMDVLDIERADGTRTKVTLRRYLPDASDHKHDIALEHRILRFLETTDVPVAKPLWLDAEGDLLGAPAMALAHLPGEPLYTPRDVSSWADGLADALVQIHAITPRTYDLSWLGTTLRDSMRAEIERRAAQAAGRSALAREVHVALDRGYRRVTWIEPSFIHDDYWPGNTIWHRERLMGVIDWSEAEVGDPRMDVAQCRVDIAISLGLAAADAFLASYQSRLATPLPDLWFFDLLRGLRALLYYHLWVDGYQDAGLTQITRPLALGRLRRFVRRALAEAPA